ncbi:MAG: PilZ domain-containing protein [Terriglobia bacterium]
MTIERRRSDRLTLTLPLLIRGVDENGEEFECEAQTINVNRDGARIRIPRFLRSGQQVKVVNKLSQREAVFRVAGPLAPLTEKGGEFGFMGPIALENQQKSETGSISIDSCASLWGIRFPPLVAGQDSVPMALLACRQCKTAEMVHTSMIEIEVLETSGILARQCVKCGSQTPWGYSESEINTADSPGEAPLPAGATAAERRRHRRVVLQMPILIRDYFGGVEVTKSENVSKGGVGFASEKVYQIGEGVMIACPYDKASHNIEVPGHIASRREIAGTNCNIYGVRYKGKV